MPSIDGINFSPQTARVVRSLGSGYAVLVGIGKDKPDMALGDGLSELEANRLRGRLNELDDDAKLRTCDVCGGLKAPVLKVDDGFRVRRSRTVQQVFPEFVRRK